MADLIPYEQEPWPPEGWTLVKIRYNLLHVAEDWVRASEVPGQCMAKVVQEQTAHGWSVSLAISDPDVAFDFKMRFG